MKTINDTKGEWHQYVVDWETFKEKKDMNQQMRIEKVDNGYIIKENKWNLEEETVKVYTRWKDVMKRITEFFGEGEIKKKKKKGGGDIK